MGCIHGGILSWTFGRLHRYCKSINYATRWSGLNLKFMGGGGFPYILKMSLITGKRVSALWCGNFYYDNDSIPSYPSSYESENIISVRHIIKAKSLGFPMGQKQCRSLCTRVNVQHLTRNKYKGLMEPHGYSSCIRCYASVRLNPTWTVIEVKNALLTLIRQGLANKCVLVAKPF